MIPPAFALTYVAPNLLNSLPDDERLIAAYTHDLWLRPEQRLPPGLWRSVLFIAGRGWGKSFAIATEINRRVALGEARSIALMAPTEDRVKEVQADFLVRASPPWFPAEHYRGGARWPNGVEAVAFTPEAPERTRSGNFDLSWLCELVDWQATTRMAAYQSITTATRVGRAQVIGDTTSKGKNEVIQYWMAACERDPQANRLIRGSMFDNPLLSKTYLREEAAKYVIGSRRYREEIGGEVFFESACALWRQDWIDDNRHEIRPTSPDLTILGLDPALSAHPDADLTGIVEVCRTATNPPAPEKPLDHYHVTEDFSGRYSPEQWGALVVDRCAKGAAGIVLERNHLGDHPTATIRVHAEQRGMRVEVLKSDRPFPRRTPGRIYVREMVSRSDKSCRASAPASLYQAGRVHHVGVLDALELEMTLWEPGTRRSPNRLDALAFAINELAGLHQEKPRPSEGAVAGAAGLARELDLALRSRPRIL